MPRFATDDGKGTNDPAQEQQKDANGQPVANAVVGIALLLAGAGFIILAFGSALCRPEAAAAPAPSAAAPTGG